jgi:Protein of unknown function (DUF3995)
MLAFASAAVSLYWTLGGTALLDALGGTYERLARDRSMAALALGIGVVLIKVAGGLAALALVRPRGAGFGRRLLLVPIVVGSLILVLYGGVEVLAGGLVLADVITPSGPVDEHALRWHVFMWDPWFLVWGVALGIAAWRYAREGRTPSGSRRTLRRFDS